MDWPTGVPIGRGATGEVFKVFDPRLERTVALKLLHRDEPELVERFLAEARAQARVDHPNICKVYEIGERDGRPCIVLQYVAGETLDRVAPELGREELVALLATVADAVAAAHAVGLVHRDLKPGNVLVERGDGGATPYVVDFGLARDVEGVGRTLTGQILGTPGYLAPEQARGERSAIDRRSDVWSLGVMLYELLVGRRPFAGASPPEALLAILRDDPVPPRRLRPDLPRDLETIVLRCLEKEAERRYGSAAELAADLRRWLAGEPIAARPLGPAGRLWRRARRHPAVAASVGLAVAALIVATALGAWSLWRASESERLAQRFAARTERARLEMRLARQLPLHDVSADRERLAAEIGDLRAEASRLGRRGRAAARAAIGTALAEMGRREEARAELRAALVDAPGSARARLALGLVEAELWLEARTRAARSSPPALRVESVAAVDREIGARARELLAGLASEDVDVHERRRLEAVVALVDGDAARARRLGEEATARRPWFHEGLLVAGEAALAEGVAALGAGEGGRAREGFETARRFAARAAAVAPSDPRSWQLEGEAESWLFELDRLEAGAPPRGYEAAVAAFERALEADSRHPAALDRLAETAWKRAQERTRAGEDPAVELALARAAAERLREVPDGEARAEAHLGYVEWVAAMRARDVGGEVEAALARATAHLERSLALAPGDGYARLALGNTLTRRSEIEAESGRDFLPTVEQAVAAFRGGVGQPGVFPAQLWNGICAAEGGAGYHLALRGEDASGRIRRAVDACDRALELSPAFLNSRNNLGLNLWTLGLIEHWRDRDAGAAFERAAEVLGALHAEAPERASTRLNLVGVQTDRLAWQADRGAIDGALLAAAEQTLAPIEEIHPPDFHYYSARLRILEARAARATDPPLAERLLEGADRHARAAVGEARENLNYNNLSYRLVLGEARLRLAARRLEAGERVDGPALDELTRWILETRRLDAASLDARAQEAALGLLAAAVRGGAAALEDAFRDAAAASQQIAPLRSDLGRLIRRFERLAARAA